MSETHQDEIDADNGSYEAYEQERLKDIPKVCPECGNPTIVRAEDQDYICPFCEEMYAATTDERK